MTVYVIIHTTVDDTETHHREIVPKIMEAVRRHGGKRIALGHGDQLRVHEGEPPVYNRVSFMSFPAPRPRRPGPRSFASTAISFTRSAT
jgi:hypothetical protein